MSRDQGSFLSITCQGSILTLRHWSCGVIRNQRSKICRSDRSTTAGGTFRKVTKFECSDLERS